MNLEENHVQAVFLLVGTQDCDGSRRVTKRVKGTPMKFDNLKVVSYVLPWISQRFGCSCVPMVFFVFCQNVGWKPPARGIRNRSTKVFFFLAPLLADIK